MTIKDTSTLTYAQVCSLGPVVTEAIERMNTAYRVVCKTPEWLAYQEARKLCDEAMRNLDDVMIRALRYSKECPMVVVE